MTDEPTLREQLGDAMIKICAIALCLASAQPAIAAEPQYGAYASKVLSMDIRSNVPETDALLIATCLTTDMLDVRIGGELPLGSGEHESVSVTLSSGTLSTRVDGVSVKSPDYEMTGSAMLLTSLEPKGKAWRILTSGKPIEIRASGRAPDKISLGKPATDALRAFVSKCS